LGLFAVLGIIVGCATGVSHKSSPPVAVNAMLVLRDNCIACHGAEKHKGGLTLSSRKGLLAGADAGPVVSATNPEESLILRVLQAEADPHMPPKKQLTPRQIGILRDWVQAGTPWDEAALRQNPTHAEIKWRPLPASYQPVLALALSPDGSRLAVGRGSRVLLYDLSVTNFPVVSETNAHRDVVRSLAWSPDGRRLASGSHGELHVRNVADLSLAWQTGSNLTGRVTALVFSPFGGALVAAESPAGSAAWVRVFAAENGNPISAWSAHDDAINALAITPEGGRLASAGGDKLIKLWELISQTEVARYEGHVGAVTGVAFNTNATELFSIGGDKQIKLWDVKSRESVVSIAGRKHGLTAAAWSADGKTVVVADEDGRAYTFKEFQRHSGAQSSETAREKQLGRWEDALHSVAVNADGTRIVVGGQDGVVRVLDQNGKVQASLGPATELPADANAGTAIAAKETVPSFVHDVLPALARAGCAAGSCHAKPEGQNGFKLSVFSYDPRSDYAEIVKDGRGRRVSPGSPEASLLLLKPTLTLDHEGGQRFEPGSPVYRMLVEWITAGMPYQRTNEPSLVSLHVATATGTYRHGAKASLTATARYDDGSERDVTALTEFVSQDKELVTVDESGLMRVGKNNGESVVVARFMGQVDAARVTVPADKLLPASCYEGLPTANFIDELAYAHFQKLGLFPSAKSSDAEFLRRSTLDTIGRLPTVAEARAFLADPAPDKRQRWTEQLLADPAWADYWANKWADLLRPNPDRVGVKSVYLLDQWLRAAFRENLRYDEFARALLTVEGSNHRDGPAVVYRDRREPADLTTIFSQVLLGVRMECAKCHHHPNEKWSQDDFYQFAAYFGPVKQKGAGLSPPISAGNETFYFASGGTVKHPVTEAVLAPRPLDGPKAELKEKDDPRLALAEWLTNPENPYFARAAVNRVWGNYFGRGFVEPVDDFRVSNPAVNEPLLNALAADFARHGFDLKHVMRRILNSELYQLSSTPNETNLSDTKNFSRSARRRLPAEAMLDAVCDVTGVPDTFDGCPPGTRAIQTWTFKTPSHFLDAFGRPNASTDAPCERDLRTSVVQALHLMNSQALQAKLANPQGRARLLAASDRPPEEIVTELYLAAFTRPPTSEELAAASARFGSEAKELQAAVEDVLWALLNSPEFVFNH
jgi:hypothetical protein